MNTSVIKRFLTALSSAVEIERGQLYQLVQSAETSYYLRDVNSQRAVGLVLQGFAYPFNQIGKYYESMFLFRTGQHEKAKQLLESVADSAPSQYRSRAMLSLSGIEENMGHFEDSLNLRLQVLSSDNPVSIMEAQWGIAALRSLEGENEKALRDLERFLPRAHIIGRQNNLAYMKFLNSYAVELSESGKAEDAEQVANVIAASPLIGRYPEWQETITEVLSKRRTRSTVSISLPQETDNKIKHVERASNVLQFPSGERVLQVRAALESDEITELSLTPLQLLALILKMMLEERVSDDEVEKICVLYYDTVTKWYPQDWPSGI